MTDFIRAWHQGEGLGAAVNAFIPLSFELGEAGRIASSLLRLDLVILDELLEALDQGWTAQAAVDVFDIAPLPADHSFRHAKSLLATPHIGYVADDLHHVFYRNTVAQILDWLGGPGSPKE